MSGSRSCTELEGLWPAGRGQHRVVHSIHDERVLVRGSHRSDVHRS